MGSQGKKKVFKVNGIGVNRYLWGSLERADGTPVPPEAYSDIQDLIYETLDELYHDGKLDPSLVQRKLTTANWREIGAKVGKDWPEFEYCSANWKLRAFLRVYMPTWKEKRGLGGTASGSGPGGSLDDSDSNPGSKRKPKASLQGQ